MRRTPLYSSSGRSRGVPSARGEPAASPTNLEAAGSAAPEGAPPMPPTRRARLRAFLRRHNALLSLVTGIAIALAVVYGYDATRHAQQALTQDDIDSAVLHTL
jgi:hypothetical protein